MKLRPSSLYMFEGFGQDSVQAHEATRRTRLAHVLGMLCVLTIVLAACSDPAAVAQSTPQTSGSKIRQMVIEDQEVIYIAVSNAKEPIKIEDWLAAGWTLGAKVGAKSAVPQDCALHAREGVDLQVFATCPGPRQIEVPRNAADFVYIVFIFGKNSEAQVERITTPQ